MNSLEAHIRAKSLNEIDSMNALQDAGVVSDLCIFACDVAESDCTAAIAFLTLREITPKTHPKLGSVSERLARGEYVPPSIK
jgi:hypothetical protein